MQSAFKVNGSQKHGGDNGNGIGFEKVGSHACTVAYVVAYVVSNNGRVARVVFRNAGFDFAYKVSAYVSAFGENTAAKTGENGN